MPVALAIRGSIPAHDIRTYITIDHADVYRGLGVWEYLADALIFIFFYLYSLLYKIESNKNTKVAIFKEICTKAFLS